MTPSESNKRLKNKKEIKHFQVKKIFTFTIISFLFSFTGFTQQFTKVIGNTITKIQEGYGGTWADYDNDGDLDLYVNVRFPSVNNPNAFNYLFQNNCNGNFTRIMAIPGGLASEPWQVQLPWGQSLPATWVDYDNDGDEDLFVSRTDTISLLYRNNGDGTFTKITTLSFVNDNGNIRYHSFIDFDNDGDLDLLLMRLLGFNTIYKNESNGIYTTLQPFFDSTGNAAGAWGDYDNDGYMDLFTIVMTLQPPTNPTGFLRLFHNNGNNTFSQIINGVPAAFGSYQYDPSWIDYDNDGDLDVFIRGSFGSPNLLYRNNGNGTFTSIPAAGGLSSLVHNNGGVAWGDYDNDGDLDVYMSAFFFGNLLYKNNGNGTFTEYSTEIVTNDTIVESYGATFVDYDNDGDLDLYVCNAFSEAESFLYRNNGNSNHYLDVKCKGTSSNKDAIGARIYVKAIISGQPRWQMREINTNTSFTFGGLAPLNQHFGLGDATVIDSLKVVWPVSHTTQIFTNVSSDRFIEITEGINAVAEAKPCKPDLLPKNPAVITGKVFSDTDNDCAFNSSSDFPVANRIMQANPGPDFVFSNSNGDYDFRLNGGVYNVTQATIANDLWNLQNCQPSDTYTVSVNNGDTAAGKNFALNAVSAPICNATVNLNSIPMVFADSCPSGLLLTSPCPGSQWRYCVTITNTGSTPIGPGSQLQIVLDADMVFLNMFGPDLCGLGTPIITGCAPCTLTWTTPLIGTGSSCNICFDVMVNSATGTPPYSTTANFFANCGVQTVVPTPTDVDLSSTACSCDPNDKLVAPKGCGPLGNISKTQPLTYTVRFQNTGTGPAHDLVIRDVLDNDLDITTLKIIASSHTITHVQIIPDNALIISYEGIELPDSGSNPLGSNGFVAFSIKPKSNLPEGTQITNQAGIYFDFNEVVLTNSTLNTLRDAPEPIADFTAKHSCTNIGFIYDFTYTGGTADNATFLWDFGISASPQTSTQQNPSGIVFSSIGTKSVTLTVTRFGCASTVTKNVNVISVLSGTNNNKITICHKPTKGNSQTITIDLSAIPAHLAHGDCVGPCGTATTRLESNNQSENITWDESVIEVYPNPAKENIVFHYSLPESFQTAEINLYDVMGRKIKSIPLTISETIMFNTSSLNEGIYFITLSIDGAIKDKNKFFIIK